MSYATTATDAPHDAKGDTMTLDTIRPTRGRARPTRNDPTLGLELFCRSCDAKGDPDPWWPVESDFWFLDADGWPIGHCRACFSERVRLPDGRRVFPHQTLRVGAA